MEIIDAANLDYRAVNEALRGAGSDCTIDGCCGQRFIAAGYSMRCGKIYVQGNAGYRAGIHMKVYKEKIPVMIIGRCAGK